MDPLIAFIPVSFIGLLAGAALGGWMLGHAPRMRGLLAMTAIICLVGALAASRSAGPGGAVQLAVETGTAEALGAALALRAAFLALALGVLAAMAFRKAVGQILALVATGCFAMPMYFLMLAQASVGAPPF